MGVRVFWYEVTWKRLSEKLYSIFRLMRFALFSGFRYSMVGKKELSLMLDVRRDGYIEGI